MALGAGGKTGIARQGPETKSQNIFRRPKNVVMDEDFFDDRNNEGYEKGQQGKNKNEDTKWSVMYY